LRARCTAQGGTLSFDDLGRCCATGPIRARTTPSKLQRFLGLLRNEFERTLKNAISLQ
jgi:hypothetical protein